MLTDLKQPWILVGYALFANHGPQGLKVEVIARQVQKSKSSFYHHFADLEVFTELLLQYHLLQCAHIAEHERNCQQLIPDLIELLLSFKQDLLFSRQLRIHNQVPAFRRCFEAANALVGDALLEVWADSIGLTQQKALAGNLLHLVTEKFYLQMTAEKFSYEWLLQFFQSTLALAGDFQKGVD
ncbi:MAG TPA: TetR/AcrR family transcriptional regulator [Microscillaceae bacterium]|jgi:AcrR family transcriptional regulator|nr:TetR/AcrR family transcriptional regulator [Microscillaceae bacterium]